MMEMKMCSCCGFDIEIIRRATKAVRDADATFQKVGGTSRHWIHECFLPALDREGLRLVDDNLGTYDPATHVVVSRDRLTHYADVLDSLPVTTLTVLQIAAELRAALEGKP